MTAREVIVKTAVVHTVTYFVAGVSAYLLFDYPTLIRETELGTAMRSLRDPLVIAAPALQPLRGALFGYVFFLLRDRLFVPSSGWLTIWAFLVVVGIVGPFGSPPGSLEGYFYTTLPARLHLTVLAELLSQSLALSWLVFQWVRHPEMKSLTLVMGISVALILLFPILALFGGGR